MFSELIASQLWPPVPDKANLGTCDILSFKLELHFKWPIKTLRWTSVYFTLNLKNRHISCWERTCACTHHERETILYLIHKKLRDTDKRKHRHYVFFHIIHRLRNNTRRESSKPVLLPPYFWTFDTTMRMRSESEEVKSQHPSHQTRTIQTFILWSSSHVSVNNRYKKKPKPS